MRTAQRFIEPDAIHIPQPQNAFASDDDTASFLLFKILAGVVELRAWYNTAV